MLNAPPRIAIVVAFTFVQETPFPGVARRLHNVRLKTFVRNLNVGDRPLVRFDDKIGQNHDFDGAGFLRNIPGFGTQILDFKICGATRARKCQGKNNKPNGACSHQVSSNEYWRT